jgi:hypothetical protein
VRLARCIATQRPTRFRGLAANHLWQLRILNHAAASEMFAPQRRAFAQAVDATPTAFCRSPAGESRQLKKQTTANASHDRHMN